MKCTRRFRGVSDSGAPGDASGEGSDTKAGLVLRVRMVLQCGVGAERRGQVQLRRAMMVWIRRRWRVCTAGTDYKSIQHRRPPEVHC